MHRRNNAWPLIAFGQAAAVLGASLVLVGSAPSTSVVLDDAEAQAAVAILVGEKNGRVPSNDDWNRLFQTEGYRRLKQREADFKHPFTDSDFRAFLTGADEVAKADQLQATLAAWRSKDLSEMEARARVYLPAGAGLRATVYPLVKPHTNSFVYQLDTDPAIMLYLEPALSADQFSNTVSHELLHVGDAENCPPKDVARDEKSFTPQQAAFNEWLSAFGEGWAVLAAAGGPNVDPHWEDPQHDRDLWNAQMSHLVSDFQDLQSFFQSIMNGTLHGDAIATKGLTYFGDYQGPWYTVGYAMDTTIEQEFDRATLVSVLCDKRRYLATYNAAAQKKNQSNSKQLPLWKQDVVDFLKR